MTKLLSLLSLTTALSTTSVLPLVQENNNQISTKQNTNSNEMVIDNINQKMSTTAEAGTDSKEDMIEYKRVLDLSWEEAKTITNAVATNYFAHFLSTATLLYYELSLKKIKTENPNQIVLLGLSIKDTIKGDVSQMSRIIVLLTLEKMENNPKLTETKLSLLSDSSNVNTNKSCRTEYFLNKIILNKQS